MAFENTNKANVAFKNLQNKSHTDSSKEIGAEADSIFFNIDSTTIFTDTIDPTPSVAETNGIAFQVTAELVYDTSSNNQAWKAVWPTPLPAGAPDGVSSGDRVTNAISAAYGVPYEAKPYDINDDLISPGDPRAWIYQYQSGVFYQQDNVGALPKEIILYVYTGTYLNDALENTGSGDVSSINYASANMDMTCNTATIGDKVSELQVIEFPISDVLVKLNGLQINVGETKDCYFSPDGLSIRKGSSAAKGDYLYWNSDKYDLDPVDECDLVYMVQTNTETINDGDTIVIDNNTETQNLSFTGIIGQTATVNLNGVLITVGNVGNDFVWDIGGLQEHTFTEANTYIEVIYSTLEYVIWYDGLGSLLFSLKNIIPILTDQGLTTLATSGFGDLASNTGLSVKPYDITGVRFELDSASGDFSTGADAYTGLTGTMITQAQSDVDGDYAFNGDPLNTTATFEGLIKSPDGLYLYGTSAEAGAGLNGYFKYEIATNTNTFISAASTQVGGDNEVNGDPLTDAQACSGILLHPTKNLIYLGVGYDMWEYNIDTNTGTLILLSANGAQGIRDISYDPNNDVVFTAGWHSYFNEWDVTNRTLTWLTAPDSGDGFPRNDTNSVRPSPYGDYLGLAFARTTEGHILEMGTSTIGRTYSVATTGPGGSHEVLGDAVASDSLELANWMLDDNGDQIYINSARGHGIWFYNIETNYGKWLTPTTTAQGGAREVNGDPMPHVNMMNFYVSEDYSTLYASTGNGLWVYNILTNTGKTYNSVTMAPSGDSPTNLDVCDDVYTFAYPQSTVVIDYGAYKDIYLSNANYNSGTEVGIYALRGDGYTLYDYGWFEDSQGNPKSKYALASGDKLHLNTAKIGFNLAGTEELSFKYYQ